MFTFEEVKRLILRTNYCCRYGLEDSDVTSEGDWLFLVRLPIIDYNHKIIVRLAEIKGGLLLMAKICKVSPDLELFETINKYNHFNAFTALYHDFNKSVYIEGFYIRIITSDAIIQAFDNFMDQLNCDYNGDLKKIYRKGIY